MRYELFLRRAAELTDDELAAIDEAARSLDATFIVDRFALEGRIVGVDLGLSVSRVTGAERLCAAAFAIASEHALSVFDPQLARTVAASDDDDAIARRFEAAAAFVVAAPVTNAGGPAPGWSSTMRMWVVVLGTLAAVLLAGQALRCAL